VARPPTFGNRNPALGQFGGFNRGNPAISSTAAASLGRQGLGWRNPYIVNHQNWVHGFGGWGGGWGNPFWGGGWGSPFWGLGWGFPFWGLGGLGFGGLGGLGFGGLGGWGYPGYGYGYGGYGLGGPGYGGWGVNSWAYGPSIYDWGYANYDNPYYTASATTAQPLVYNYSQPIDPTSEPPPQEVTEQALSTFDQARDAFKSGDYTAAIDLTDQALRQSPNDPTLHEFRALVLFAQQRYDEAATSLFAVLSVQPGWDWTTMIGLCPDLETYTRQLRALEEYAGRNPQSAPARFVLAYLYMTQGHIDAAIGQLKDVRQLQPRDTLTAQLLEHLERAEHSPTASAPGATASSPPPAGSTVPAPGGTAIPSPAAERNLAGTWTAEPGSGTSIALSFPDARRFVWKVTRQGKSEEFQGDRTYGNGILTLAQGGQANGPPMVGRVSWQDDTHFTFKLMGGPPGDPGLTFSKSS
jgi:tetratricopeptide (TPR) repeat protein